MLQLHDITTCLQSIITGKVYVYLSRETVAFNIFFFNLIPISMNGISKNILQITHGQIC